MLAIFNVRCYNFIIILWRSIMKKLCRYLILCVLLFGAVSVFPLTAESKEADVYYVHTQLLKIFSHPKGYYVIYRRAGMETGEAFIPFEWLSPKENKADISFINTRINPYLSFFIRDGKFEGVESLALEF